jgi:GTP-binding protein LepA
LNLIDTPGHVDFSYEVSRSLAACEGALLVVDASQGIEAQTLANVYLALENNLEIIPVLNKIDLPAADPDRVAEEIEQTIGLDCSDIVHASAKAGIGIQDILERIVRNVPAPPAGTGGPFRALIFDSYYDAYRGVVVFFRVVDGQVATGDKVRFLASSAEHEVTQVGVMQPNEVPVPLLRAGEVGYLWGNIKDVMDATVGDTIVIASEYKKSKAAGLDPPIQPLPGYAKSVPMVYCGLFPVDADQYESLRDALGKLRLNDAALSYEPENSGAMGFGFRCGFLGLLHMEIVQERLEREYNIDLIVTAPSVVYKVKTKDEELVVDAPSKMPDLMRDDVAMEPYVKMEILTPSEYNGAIIELGQERRGILMEIKYLTPTRSTIVYELPLAEVITDFFNALKSATKGYGKSSFASSRWNIAFTLLIFYYVHWQHRMNLLLLITVQVTWSD